MRSAVINWQTGPGQSCVNEMDIGWFCDNLNNERLRIDLKKVLQQGNHNTIVIFI